MSRIQATFERLGREGRKALIPYVTAGDPDAAATVAIMHAMVDAGADVIELGVPFSDPMADGPVIQRAGERALKRGTGLPQVLAMVKEFRGRNDRMPVVLMGYANPIEALGTERFVKAARDAGVDGVIVVDYPPEECGPFAESMRKAGMDPVFLLAPTSTTQRIAAVAAIASGYIYYVSLKGITGAAHLDLADVEKNIGRIRKATRLPIGVGFGVRDGATARAICRFADAAVIGSRIVQEVESAAHGQAAYQVGAFLRSVRQAMDEDRKVAS
jgi:tryptophan synthase alpha chain